MTGVVIAVVLVLLVWRFARRRRAATLAGLNGQKPTFSVTPSVRSLLDRKDFRL